MDGAGAGELLELDAAAGDAALPRGHTCLTGHQGQPQFKRSTDNGHLKILIQDNLFHRIFKYASVIQFCDNSSDI